MKQGLPQVALAVHDECHGFVVRKVTPLHNLRAAACELEHRATGARVLHVQADDAENLFSIAFRTPPPDDTGLPHILEHAVLAGSKKYPVKDPFFTMVKMSMATFINAFTDYDNTVYPVASNVPKDFFNLAEVYCDAVFHPRLTEWTFKQEGHRLEFAKKGDPTSELLIKGIVYNEMKGAYSSADNLVFSRSFRNLFPSTPYGRDAGGNPERIPELTYANFKRFHATMYHPSNALFFLYGDIPTVELLAFLAKQLKGFKRRSARVEIPAQRRWRQARTVSEPYPIGPEDETRERAYITVNWIVGDGTDAREVLAFSLLDLILLGNEAAPLRKALIDSKLGQDLSDAGYAADNLQSTFHIGLKGSEPDRKDKVEKLVLETLRSIVAKGIPPDAVEAAFQQVAYRYLEIQSMFPLHLMGRALSTWMYGADPLAFLRADELISDLRRQYETDPKMFARLIRERLLDNPHRVTMTFVPDRELLARKEAAFAQRMSEHKAKLTKTQLRRITQDAAELERRQGTPDPASALATLPQLKVRDLPPKPRHIPTTVERLDEDFTLLRNDVFANGVNYLHLNINLDGLPSDLCEYLPLYGDCVTKMGAAGVSYIKMAERVAAHTGGVNCYAGGNAHVADAARAVRYARFTVKWLDAKTDDALAVLRELLFAVDPRDAARLRDVLIQCKAAHRSALVENGVNLALRHAARTFSHEAQFNEILGGLPQPRLIEGLADQFDKSREQIVAKVEAIREFMLERGRYTASFTGSDAVANRLRPTLAGWHAQMRPASRTPRATSSISPAAHAAPRREGLAAPMEVAYCAQVIGAPHISHPDTPLLGIASRLLSLDYILEEVRIKGGAYGGGCGHNALFRTWQFYSYRDPWVKKTLDVFSGLRDYVAKRKWSQTDIDRAIIGTAKEGERPIRPAAATADALWRHLMGDSHELREQRHAAILRATPKEVKRAVIELLENNFANGNICVVSSREKLEQANLDMPNAPLVIEDIMK